MLALCLVAVPVLALLVLLAAYAVAGREPSPRVLPAARATALISTGIAYGACVAHLFIH